MIYVRVQRAVYSNVHIVFMYDESKEQKSCEACSSLKLADTLQSGRLVAACVLLEAV